MNVAILHYAAPPTVGGVEQTIYYHARELTRAGHHVRILAGAGAPFDPRVEVVIAPEFSSRHPDVLAVKAQLDRGEVTSDFVALRERLKALLARLLSNVDALIAHNLFTLHKNLPLTAALYDLLPPSPPLSGAGERSFPAVLAWHHDLAWDSARYRKDLHEGYPWDLLRRPWPGVRHVTVSAAQQARLAALYDLPPGAYRRRTAGGGPGPLLPLDGDDAPSGERTPAMGCRPAPAAPGADHPAQERGDGAAHPGSAADTALIPPTPFSPQLRGKERHLPSPTAWESGWG
jgi:glycosyltransferase involved in cell wall biosynthesis